MASKLVAIRVAGVPDNKKEHNYFDFKELEPDFENGYWIKSYNVTPLAMGGTGYNGSYLITVLLSND